MSNPYKLASTGFLFLLIQMVIVLLLMIVMAVGMSTKNPLILRQWATFSVYIMGAVLLPGAVGKVLCLLSKISPFGRICIGLSVLCEFGVAISAFMNLPPVIHAITQMGAFIFLFGYLLILANDLKSREGKIVLISAFVCMLISAVSIGIMPVFRNEDMIVLAASVIGLGTAVYGTMLYMRSLVFLRRAIAKWEPVSESAKEDSKLG